MILAGTPRSVRACKKRCVDSSSVENEWAPNGVEDVGRLSCRAREASDAAVPLEGSCNLVCDPAERSSACNDGCACDVAGPPTVVESTVVNLICGSVARVFMSGSRDQCHNRAVFVAIVIGEQLHTCGVRCASLWLHVHTAEGV